jgi:hypothetical protein
VKLQTSSTSPLNAWLEPNPRLEGLALIDHLFNRLDGLYLNKWRSSFANTQAIENWRIAWSEAFADEGVTADEVRAGLRACRRRNWPPSFAEFFEDCRPTIDCQAALIEAIEQMARRDSGNDRWSHRAIYWAAVKVGRFNLLSRTVKELDTEWRKAFSEQLARGQWEEIPARLAALPAPGQTHSRELGKASIGDMLRMLQGKDEPEEAA